MSVVVCVEQWVFHVQVFFVDEKSMPGWCVVLKKEARGRHINCTELEHVLGQEESMGDRETFPEIHGRRRRREGHQRPT